MSTPVTHVLLAALGGQPLEDRGVDWDRVATLALRHRLAGLMWSLWRQHDVFPPGIAPTFEGAHRAQAVAATVLLEEVERVRAVLGHQNIRIGLIKGAALVSDGIYEPGARALDDADVVVPPYVPKRALETLIEAGYVPWSDDVLETIPWSDAATFYLSPGHQLLDLSIDIHWSTNYGSLRYGEGDAALPRDAFAAESGSLIPEYHLVLVLEHFLKHLRYRIHLAGIGDALRLLDHVHDWDLVERLVRESRWRRALTATLVSAVSATGRGTLPGTFVRRADLGLVRRLDPALLIGRTSLGRTPVGGLVSRWRLVGPGQLLHDVRSAIFPPAEWLAARYKSRRHSSTTILWGRHAARLLGWTLRLTPSPLSPNQE